jgi:hypothetical protein
MRREAPREENVKIPHGVTSRKRKRRSHVHLATTGHMTFSRIDSIKDGIFESCGQRVQRGQGGCPCRENRSKFRKKRQSVAFYGFPKPRSSDLAVVLWSAVARHRFGYYRFKPPSLLNQFRRPLFASLLATPPKADGLLSTSLIRCTAPAHTQQPSRGRLFDPPAHLRENTEILQGGHRPAGWPP